VVLFSDGWIEVYGPDTLDVLVVNRLHVTSPDTGKLADEYIDATIPPAYREVCRPGNLRAVGQCRKVTAEDEIDRRHALHLVRGLLDIGREPAREPITVSVKENRP